MNQIFASNAPWIVGRPALFEYALEDFLGELGRQRPWTRSRVGEWLEGLEAWLEARLGRPARLEEVSAEGVTDWLESLPFDDRADAQDALRGFAEYLTGWGWLEVSPWSLELEARD
jgi:hypothetical protein